MVVQHNLTAMNSNRMLGLTVKQQAKSTEKLSSGYKINRAADDAAGLSISEKMRKQIRGLTQASLNAQDGISAVQTAEGAMHEIQDMLQRMNELAVKAANGTNSEDDRSYIQDEIDQLITEIDRVSETTKFNETYLLKGDLEAKAEDKAIDFKYKDAAILKQDIYFVENNEVKTIKAGTFFNAIDKTVPYYSSNVGVSAGEQALEADSATYLSEVNVVTDEGLFLSKDDGTFVKVNVGDVLKDGATYYSAEASAAGGVIESTLASVDPNSEANYIVIKDLYDSNGDKVALNTNIGATAADIENYFKTTTRVFLGDATQSIANIANYSTSGRVQFVDANGNEIAANGLYRYLDKEGNLLADAELYVKTGEGLIDRRIAQQADVDTLVNKQDKYEVGSLALKLHVGADSTKNNQITLDLDSISSRVLGIDEIKVNGKDDTNALNAIETVKEALQRVSTQRSALGAVQNRLEHTINNLDNVVENTTAAESQIRDTDMATEMVRFSNNNILAQAGQAMLAQANQANQGILSILG